MNYFTKVYVNTYWFKNQNKKLCFKSTNVKFNNKREAITDFECGFCRDDPKNKLHTVKNLKKKRNTKLHLTSTTLLTT